jgi:hypothetical protein
LIELLVDPRPISTVITVDLHHQSSRTERPPSDAEARVPDTA